MKRKNRRVRLFRLDQSTARVSRKHRIHLLSYRSRGTLMSYTDHSAQRRLSRTRLFFLSRPNLVIRSDFVSHSAVFLKKCQPLHCIRLSKIMICQFQSHPHLCLRGKNIVKCARLTIMWNLKVVKQTSISLKKNIGYPK